MDKAMHDEETKAQPAKQGIGIDRRSLMIGGGLTALGALSYLRSPVMLAQPIDPDKFSAAIPETVGQWTSRKSSEIVLPPQDDSNTLYENLETRIYEGVGLPSIMFLVAFNSIQQNDVHAHRPEVCYPAGGFPILQNQPIEVDFGSKTIAGRELLADRGGPTERIIYWLRVGTTFTTSWAEQRLAMALQNLQGIVPDGTLVRVSSIEAPGNSNHAVIMQFIEEFIASTSPSFRQSVLL